MPKKIITLLSFCCLAIVSCKHEPVKIQAADGNYPPEVAKIMVTKCATAGCHNEASAGGAGDIRLDKWEHMLEGGGNGAIVVPYSPDFSSLLYYINAHPMDGEMVANPLMPKDAAPLSREEYMTIKNWIAKGCPSRSGEIPFASNADTRQKIYMTMQGCDKVAVVDAESKLVMRYIDVGRDPGIEVPHCIRVSADGKYAYVSFTAGNWVQQINTMTDQVEKQIYLGLGGQWNVLHVSPDGKNLLVSDMAGGKVVTVDINNQSVLSTFSPYVQPHGVSSNISFDTFYVTGQVGNTVHVLDKDGWLNEKVSVDGNVPNYNTSGRNLHEIIMSHDYSKYFVTCDNSDEVRVMDRKTNKLIDSIRVGHIPKEITISKTKPWLFVTCEAQPLPEFSTSSVQFQGSVTIIDYEKLKVIGEIRDKFATVHGVSVDDKNGFVYVLNRNLGTIGPAPHHTSTCGGKNGYYNVYDLNTLPNMTMPSKRYEVLPEPYSSDVRFK